MQRIKDERERAYADLLDEIERPAYVDPDGHAESVPDSESASESQPE